MYRHFVPSAALLLVFCLGCKPVEKAAPEAAHEHEHDHDHEHDHAHEGHDHEHGEHAHGEHGEPAKTLAEAIEQVETARNTIRDGLKAGEKDKADAALHQVGHVLERIPELAKESSLPAEEQEAVKKDVEELFDLWGKLDEQIHGDKEITYDEFSEKIDAVVGRLHERGEKKE